jgi:predicted ATPase
MSITEPDEPKLDITLKVSNYRSFGDKPPLELRLKDGFTAFVGPNNIGKSNILKLFYELRSLFGAPIHNLREFEQSFNQGPQGFNIGSGVRQSDWFCNKTAGDLCITIGVHHVDPAYSIEITVARDTNQFRSKLFIRGEEYPHPVAIQGSYVMYDNRQTFSIRHFVWACGILFSSTYIPAFRNVLNAGGQSQCYDIDIGEHFVRKWQELTTGHATPKETILRMRRVNRQIGDIYSYKDFQIESTSDGKQLHVHIDGAEYKLDELGSGMAEFIIAVATVAIRNPKLLLIDEPESHLHPWLQERFLTTIASFAKNATMYTTHSIGLARSTAPTMYTITKAPSGTSRAQLYEKTPMLTQFLGEMSFSAFSELGFTKIVLVEGVTDLPTMAQFLRKMGKDAKVLLLHVGGDASACDEIRQELTDLRRANVEIHAFMDSERTAKDAPPADKRTKFAKACKDLGIKCKLTDKRSIEHYFPERAIKLSAGPQYRALRNYEDFKAMGSQNWGNARNWLIAQEMDKKEFEDTDLGEFLAGL